MSASSGQLREEAVTFGLGTFASGADPGFAAVVLGEHGVAVSALRADMRNAGFDLKPSASTLDLLGDWDNAFPVLHAAVQRLRERGLESAGAALFRTDDLKPLPPVNLPRQVFCAGANYFKHVVDLI